MSKLLSKMDDLNNESYYVRKRAKHAHFHEINEQ